MKADPYAYHYETRPSNASKFYSLDGYEVERQRLVSI